MEPSVSDKIQVLDKDLNIWENFLEQLKKINNDLEFADFIHMTIYGNIGSGKSYLFNKLLDYEFDVKTKFCTGRTTVGGVLQYSFKNHIKFYNLNT